MRGLFVTGTDTDAGKTVLSAALLAAMAAAGERVGAYKPVVTGVEPGSAHDGRWAFDHEVLAAAAGASPEQVTSLTFAAAAAPHLAAELAGRRIDPSQLLGGARRAGSRGTLIVEGVGGLLVPLTDGYSVRDLAVELGLPLVVAARPGLGTINHTLLTLECARAAGLGVRAVVLTPWPPRPSRLERSNRETIARLGGVEVATLAEIPAFLLGALAEAGARLPWRGWVGGG